MAAKNIINLISVLTIWWCPCVESSLVLEEGVCYDQSVLLSNTVSFSPASFCTGRKCVAGRKPVLQAEKQYFLLFMEGASESSFPCGRSWHWAASHVLTGLEGFQGGRSITNAHLCHTHVGCAFLSETWFSCPKISLPFLEGCAQYENAAIHKLLGLRS